MMRASEDSRRSGNDRLVNREDAEYVGLPHGADFIEGALLARLIWAYS